MSRSDVWDVGRLRGWRFVAQAGGTPVLERLAARMRRQRRSVVIALLSSAAAAFAVAEVRTSWLQSHLLSVVDRQLTFQVEPGDGPPLGAPRGPYDERLGYSRLRQYVPRLSAYGFRVIAHAHVSWMLSGLVELGLPPVYHEKTQTGLSILDRRGDPLYTARYPTRVYRRFEDIPPLVMRTLLFIENRELLEPASASRNPAIEWDRLGHAAFDLGRGRFPETLARVLWSLTRQLMHRSFGSHNRLRGVLHRFAAPHRAAGFRAALTKYAQLLALSCHPTGICAQETLSSRQWES